MKLGCFSVSLAVKNLKKSKDFYENIGFEVFAGEESHGFLIMQMVIQTLAYFKACLKGTC